MNTIYPNHIEGTALQSRTIGQLSYGQPIQSFPDEGAERQDGGDDITQDLGFNAIWLDRSRRKMGIGIMGRDRTGMITYLTEKLSIRGLNIDAGFGSRLEEAAGAFFEISGDSTKMQDLFNEIIQERHSSSSTITNPEQQPPEPTPMNGMIYELKIIAPDRSGIVCDISQLLRKHNITIDQMVIKTKKGRETTDDKIIPTQGIIYGRLTIPSLKARNRFLANLREVKDGNLWRIKCTQWIPPQQPGDSITDSIGSLN